MDTKASHTNRGRGVVATTIQELENRVYITDDVPGYFTD